MNIWIDTGGLYLRPLAIFRLFHPLLHIRWDAIASIEPRKTLWFKAHQFTFRRDVPMMTFGQPAGQAIFDRWPAHHGGSTTSDERLVGKEYVHTCRFRDVPPH